MRTLTVPPPATRSPSWDQQLVPPTPVADFTPEEWAALKGEDKKAAWSVVGILGGIFIAAALMYGAVAIFEAMKP